MPVRPLPPKLTEKSKTELNEDPKRLEEDLSHIKDWIAKQPHLRARIDDQWLVAFLRGCKFSLEKTKEKLDLFYTCRGLVPELYRIKHTDPKFNDILELGAVFYMPPGEITEPALYIMRPGVFNPDKYSIIDIISVSLVLQKILLIENDTAVVLGTRQVLDLDGVLFSHLVQMTPAASKKIVTTSQDAVPLELKSVHYLNTPVGFEQVFNILKTLLSEESHNRLYVHNKKFDEMYKYISKESLPKEYGGNGGTIPEIIEYWKKKVQEYSSWLEEDEQYGTDESKRPGKPKTAEDMTGVEGSFRQLQFD